MASTTIFDTFVEKIQVSEANLVYKQKVSRELRSSNKKLSDTCNQLESRNSQIQNRIIKTKDDIQEKKCTKALINVSVEAKERYETDLIDKLAHISKSEKQARQQLDTAVHQIKKQIGAFSIAYGCCVKEPAKQKKRQNIQSQINPNLQQVENLYSQIDKLTEMKGNIDRLKEELSLKKTELERLRKTKLNLEKDCQAQLQELSRLKSKKETKNSIRVLTEERVSANDQDIQQHRQYSLGQETHGGQRGNNHSLDGCVGGKIPGQPKSTGRYIGQHNAGQLGVVVGRYGEQYDASQYAVQYTARRYGGQYTAGQYGGNYNAGQFAGQRTAGQLSEQFTAGHAKQYNSGLQNPGVGYFGHHSSGHDFSSEPFMGHARSSALYSKHDGARDISTPQHEDSTGRYCSEQGGSVQNNEQVRGRKYSGQQISPFHNKMSMSEDHVPKLMTEKTRFKFRKIVKDTAGFKDSSIQIRSNLSHQQDQQFKETDGPAGLLQGSTSLSSGQSKVGRINSPASLDFQDNLLARPSSQFKSLGGGGGIFSPTKSELGSQVELQFCLSNLETNSSVFDKDLNSQHSRRREASPAIPSSAIKSAMIRQQLHQKVATVTCSPAKQTLKGLQSQGGERENPSQIKHVVKGRPHRHEQAGSKDAAHSSPKQQQLKKDVRTKAVKAGDEKQMSDDGLFLKPTAPARRAKSRATI